MTLPRITIGILSLGLALSALALAEPAADPAPPAPREDRMEPLPHDLEGLEDVTEHLSETLPLNLTFRDENDKQVKLGDYFAKGRPVVLTLNYYGCPGLCTYTLNGMVDALRDVPLKPGTDFDIVTVSFNPVETFRLAQIKKQNYVKYYDEPGANVGWHFLTGEQAEITALTEATGFPYKWLPDTQQFAHPAVVMIATPDGVLSRYLYGVAFDPPTLKLSLIEAGKGRIGTPLDKIILWCYHYDASTGTYAPVAFNIMRLGGALTLLIFGIVLALFWANEKRRQPPAARPGPPAVLGESRA